VVHALSPGRAHKLGIENGMASIRWGWTQPEAATTPF